MERAVEKNEKLESFELEITKLEIYHLSSKVPIKVWKFFNAVSSNGKFSNFGSDVPISFRTFQVQSFQLLVFLTVFSNYMYLEKEEQLEKTTS